uniref:Endosome-lysosome associated apoptosis and autophagy regulator family member 2 n=1 Tax=Latimeria chalumnae TaxID=7897 RepID=H3AUB7_LATCH
QTDYHFEYTECDSSGSRWRVAVPNADGTCTGLPDPVKGKECTFSCAAGEYLEMKNQVCSKCAAGTYSLGSGIRFDEWDDLPPGFSNVATFMDSVVGTDSSNENCNASSWIPQGNYIESSRDDCTVSLIYAVHLKKSGSVTFDYQYLDNNIFFEFFIQNDQCQDTDTSTEKWMKLTENSEWKTHTVPLNSGTNILYWRTTGILLDSKVVKPVMVRNIEIEGVAYTSECFPCKPGTFSAEPGSLSCKICPRNTYSEKGDTSCKDCNVNTHFSEEGSSKCQARLPCTAKDYFQIHTPCDDEGKTRIMYKWIEPKFCREDIKNAIQLPPSGEKKPCPPCNPGFYNNVTSSCAPCPLGTFSDGMEECQPCPAGTEPALGFEYKWWNILPANMKTSCFNVGNSKCDEMNGWDVAGDNIQSGSGGSDNDYLILNLYIPGFNNKKKNPETLCRKMRSEIILFVTSSYCSCIGSMNFLHTVSTMNNIIIEGALSGFATTLMVADGATVWTRKHLVQNSRTRRFINDVAKIYSITVTNAMDGVASYCRACALGSEQSSSSCVPCPAGHYIDKETNTCNECPPNTYLSIHQVYGKEACIPCGPGSRSNKAHSFCYSDCLFSYAPGNQTLTYNFSNLSSVASIMSGPSFTPRGTKYYHFFNISLCGNEGKKMAVCVDNVTDVTVKEVGSGLNEDVSLVETFVCQSTIIPSDGRGFRTALSSQSISLADIFLDNVGATVEPKLLDFTIESDLFPSTSKNVPDVHFFYKSSIPTSSCGTGRTTIITLRCNPLKTGQEAISVPSHCSAGTCDGCTFYFLWESAEACPLCTENDYHEIEGACKGEVKETLYVWNEPKLCVNGVPLPKKKTSPCEAIEFWLKVGAGIGAFTAVLLIALTCYFWKKNKKLEYKYSKLVMTANTKECELPAADSCAIMEGEDNEEDIVYSNKPSLLGKLKSLATKEKDNIFESVQLKSSRSQNI